MVKLSKRNFNFFEIEKEYQENFKCATGLLSDFLCFAIRTVADAISGKETIWCDNHAWWDANDEKRMAVFMTQNGNLMLWNVSDEKMWRIEF